MAATNHNTQPDSSGENQPSGLPRAIERRIYDIVFDTPADQRAIAIEALRAQHRSRATEIDALIARVEAGMSAFPTQSKLPVSEVLAEQVGPYRVLEQLGVGGFGIVYLAEQTDPLTRQVAVKCLLPGMDTAMILDRFEAERQSLAAMHHPNIAQVFDAGTDERNQPYFVMEYVAGAPFTIYCRRNSLDLQSRLRLFQQVCAGVQHAHQKGIIHRDLKPSNVLVTAQSQKPLAKIIDFGIAKALHGPLAHRAFTTEHGRVVGTLEYMSPEQAAGSNENVDTRSDIYSLGVMLYELLTDALPFDSTRLRKAGPLEISRMICEEEPERPSSRVTTLSRSVTVATNNNETRKVTCTADQLRRDLDWVVMKALAKEPSRRFQSATQFYEDVERYLNQEPVSAHPPSLRYQLGKFASRHRTQVIAAAIVLVGTVLSLVSVIFALDRALDAESVARGEAARADGEAKNARNAETDAKAEAARADQEATRANDLLSQFGRASDVILLDRQISTAKSIWPAVPGKVPELRAWLAKSEPLAERLADHEHSLDAARRRGRTEAGEEITQFDSTRDELLYRTLRDLVSRLRTFVGPDGALTSVRSRLAFAETLHELTIVKPSAAWAKAQASVQENPAFDGLKLIPQIGLIPLGTCPESGLQEFAHLASGDPMVRGADGKLQRSPKSGLVLVLIPGGKYWMGTQKSDAKKPNYDRGSSISEIPMHEIDLSPFFISKFEVTQGQWIRCTGSSPSMTSAAGKTNVNPLRPPTPDHPVELVTWVACDRVTHELGLALPTEAQWEYAARAGTSTPYYTGASVESLKGKVNILDRATQRWAKIRSINLRGVDPRLGDDGWDLHAPVGTFPPNPWGLHDMAGNVSEWTRDRLQRYLQPARDGDGFRGTGKPGTTHTRVLRGGHCFSPPRQARSAYRQFHYATSGKEYVGLRPSRPLDF